MKKLDAVLLIDDDEITNFINHDILAEMDLANHIQVCENGKIAIDYLEGAYAGAADHYIPQLIFLDLNMPVMDGFEFLKTYQSNFPEDKRCKLVIMLTTSLRPDDLNRAIELKLVVTDYIEKPLSIEKVAGIVKQYFDFEYKAVV